MANPNDPERPRKRAHPSGQSKLGARVYPKPSKYPQITGRPNGRPRTPEVLKGAFLGCLRYGLSESTACAIVGISSSVVERWKAESPPPAVDGQPEAISFAALCEQAKSTPKLNVSRTLVQRAEKGDLAAAVFFLKSRTREYSERGGGVVPADMARQIRAFVSAAQVCQQGVPDPNAIENFDDPADDADASVGS